MSSRDNGVTLIEMVVTTTIALVLVLSTGSLNDLQRQIEGRLRQRMDPDHVQASLALLHIAKHLELADRVNPISPSNFQIRRPVRSLGCPAPDFPDPANLDCFDTAASYKWDQYKLVGEELWFWENDCAATSRKTLAKRITNLDMRLFDAESQPPPGGEVSTLDNNVVDYGVTWWDQDDRQREFRGRVTLRSSGYTDAPKGLQNPDLPGFPDLSPPPTPPCT